MFSVCLVIVVLLVLVSVSGLYWLYVWGVVLVRLRVARVGFVWIGSWFWFVFGVCAQADC